MLSELDFANVRLYGREIECASLKEKYHQSSVSRQIVWIKGNSGVGKTSLIEHVLKVKENNFCSGKFEQFHSASPFSAFVSLLRQICMILEHSPTPKIALSNDHASIMKTLVPEICHVVKPASDDHHIGDADDKSNNLEWRLELLKQAMRSFIRDVCRVLDSPLILVLDDLQWADTSSLDIIKDLLCDDDARGFLFVGSYRDDVVDQSHPLACCIQEITRNGNEGLVAQIHVPSMDLTATNRLVADITHMPREIMQPLSDLIYQKTQGNCFYTSHMMRNLHAKKLLYLSQRTGKWEWEGEKILSEFDSSENDVEFMSKKLQELSPVSREILTLAAFIGNTIDIRLLERVHCAVYGPQGGDSETVVADGLQEASHEYLVEFLSERTRFRFSHDRVAAAAYGLIPEGVERRSLHLKIGRCLQVLFITEELTEQAKRNWQVILAVYQLNRGLDLLEGTEERVALARLNLVAAEQVMDSGSFKMAGTFLETGFQLLGEDRWEKQYDLTLCLSNKFVSVLFANGALDEALQVVKEICLQARCPDDRYNAEYMHIYCLTANNRVGESIDEGLKILKNMGHPKLSAKPSMSSMLAALFRVRLMLRGTSETHLLSLPCCIDPKKLAMLKHLSNLMKAAMFADQENKTLLVLSCCRTLEMTFQHGLSEVCPFAFAVYGFILKNLGDFDGALQYANVSLTMMQKFRPVGVALTVVHGFLMPLKNPLASCVDPALSAYSVAFSSGDMPAACLIANFHLMIRYYSGLPLESIAKDGFAFCSQMMKYKQRLVLKLLLMQYRGVLEMMGRLEEMPILVRNSISDEGFETFIREGNGDENNAILTAYRNRTMHTCCMLRKMNSALKHAEIFWRSTSLRGCYVNSPLNTTLSALLSLHFWKENRKRRHWKNFRRFQQQLLLWVKRGNPNCAQYVALLDAEHLAERKAPPEDIRRCYEKSISMSKRCGYVHDAALASEYAGRYYFGQNERYWAEYYISSALSLYDDWNATAKVRQLETEFEELLVTVSSQLNLSRSSTTVSDSFVTQWGSISIAGRSREAIVTIEEEVHDDCRRMMEPAGDTFS